MVGSPSKGAKVVEDAPAITPATAEASSRASPKPVGSPKPIGSPGPASPRPQAVADAGELTGEDWEARGMPETDQDSALGEPTEEWASSSASIATSILAYRTVNGRSYHSERASNTEYWGANDERQNTAVDLQHHVFTLGIGGKLYLAPISDKIRNAIDLGTGTGIWAIDFADAHPDCQVIGTDISPIQPTWVPPNLKFEIDDFNQDWMYHDVDYVHMRWLVGSVNDWNAHTRRAYAALVPGGWAEAYEVDAEVLSDDGTVVKDSAMGQWNHIFGGGAAKLGSTAEFRPCQTGAIERGFEAAGFADVHVRVVKLPIGRWPADPSMKTIGTYERECFDTDTEGFVTYMASRGLGWSPEQITVFCAHIRAEIRNPKIHGYCYCKVVYGQKPTA